MHRVISCIGLQVSHKSIHVPDICRTKAEVNPKSTRHNMTLPSSIKSVILWEKSGSLKLPVSQSKSIKLPIFIAIWTEQGNRGVFPPWKPHLLVCVYPPWTRELGQKLFQAAGSLDSALAFACQGSPDSNLMCGKAGRGTAAFQTVREGLRACA